MNFIDRVIHVFKYGFFRDMQNGIVFCVIVIGAILFCFFYVRKLKKDRAKYLKEKYEQMEKEEQLKK